MNGPRREQNLIYVESLNGLAVNNA